MAKHNLTIVVLFCGALSLGATEITTNSGELGSFGGTFAPDLNVESAQVFFNGTNFTFTTTLGGAPAASSDYIFGVDRGLESMTLEEGFGAFAPGVLFDSVVILTTSGAIVAGLAPEESETPIIGIPVTVSGDTISANIPLADLPSSALKGSQYEVNLWPSVGIPGPLSDIAEFAPSTQGDVLVTTTPEPATLGLVALGLIGIALMRSRKRAH
jgi:hypothetical protein